MRMRVDIKGVAELHRAVVKGANVIQDLEHSIAKNGSEMQQEAMRQAPVDTGHLKRSISLSGDSLSAEIESKSEYAPYQEYGTRFQPGKPHIRPAFEKQKPIFEQDIKNIVMKATEGGG